MRTRGGNRKFRALRLDTGNFSWGSEGNALGILKLFFYYLSENVQRVKSSILYHLSAECNADNVNTDAAIFTKLCLFAGKI